jgi:hypothetical protein
MEMPMQLEPQTQRQRRDFAGVLAEWLEDWARIYSLGKREKIVFTERDLAVYGDALSDLTVEQLDTACLMASKKCQFFPTPADIRKQVEDADAKGLELEAEREWQRVLHFVARWYHPDVGIDRRGPKLSAATWHALKAAGGLYHVYQCSSDEEQWTRKRFIADYELIHQTKQVEHLLSDGDAKQILARITEGAPAPDRKALPEAKPLEYEVRPAAAARPVREKVTPIESKEELDQRATEQKRRQKEWLLEHGIVANSKVAGTNPQAPAAAER